MKLHSLIPSLVLGAVLAATAQTAAPGQPKEARPASHTGTGSMALPDSAEIGAIHHLKLQPGPLPQVVEQLQAACAKAAAEKGWSREAAAENLRKAKARVAQALGGEAIAIANKDLSKAQALADEAKAAAKAKDVLVRAEGDFNQADIVYQRLARAAQANSNLVAQQELDEAKAKRDTASATLNALREETAQKEAAQANLSKAQALFEQAQARGSAEIDAAAGDLHKALAFASMYQMPNLTYGTGTSEAQVSAALDMVDVSPLDALALIASAVGCRLSQIYGPPQEGERDVTGPHIIGYCFELSAMGGPASHPTPTTTTPNETGKSVPKPLHLPVPRRTITGSMALPPGNLEVASPITGSVSFPDPRTGEETASQQSGSVSSSAPLIPAEIDTNAQVTRIYAVGPIVGDERKENDFQDLIQEALNVDETTTSPRPPIPKLYFHKRSGVLIARATLRQQQIIEQAVAVMAQRGGVAADPDK